MNTQCKSYTSEAANLTTCIWASTGNLDGLKNCLFFCRLYKVCAELHSTVEFVTYSVSVQLCMYVVTNSWEEHVTVRCNELCHSVLVYEWHIVYD